MVQIFRQPSLLILILKGKLPNFSRISTLYKIVLKNNGSSLSSQNLLPARTELSACLRSGRAVTADLRAGRALWFYSEPGRRKLKPAPCTPEGWGGGLVFPPGGLVDLLTAWNCSLKAQPRIVCCFVFLAQMEQSKLKSLCMLEAVCKNYTT